MSRRVILERTNIKQLLEMRTSGKGTSVFLWLLQRVQFLPYVLCLSYQKHGVFYHFVMVSSLVCKSQYNSCVLTVFHYRKRIY